MSLRVIAPILFGLCGVAVLIGLGLWQLQRLEWKEAMLANIASRLAADPIPLPEQPAKDRDQYTQVITMGEVLPGELAVLTSRKPDGPGFRIISPFRTADGRLILVDRGFVPEALKVPATRAAGQGGPLVGTLLWPNETDGYTPAPDVPGNIWFARDLALMSRELGTEPILVVARDRLTGPWPLPEPLSVQIANDHLGYAITWFSLAAIWAVMSIGLVRREVRRHRAATAPGDPLARF